MSESNTESAEAEFDSKETFFEAVRDGGAVLGDLEYFTEGNGSATSYKARTDGGEVEDVKKSDVETAWEEANNGDSEDSIEDGDEEEEDSRNGEHVGTFYWTKSFTDEDCEAISEALADAGYEVGDEVSSGGFKVNVNEEA